MEPLKTPSQTVGTEAQLPLVNRHYRRGCEWGAAAEAKPASLFRAWSGGLAPEGTR